jgi:hypothetical protein
VRGGVKEVCQYAAKQGVETRRAFTDACLTFHSDGPGGPGKPEDDGSPTDECSDAIGGGPQDAAPAGACAGAHDGAPREDLPQEFPLQEFPRASELLLRSVLFPLYPALGRKDVQLIAKVLATLP